MTWQDTVFLLGSVLSLLVLVPTLRDSMANVPLRTSLPSAVVALVYGASFLTLGMTLSATGAVLTGIVWTLIAAHRSPHRFNDRRGHPTKSTHPTPHSAD